MNIHAERNIRVYRKYSPTSRSLPWLTMSGIWLEDAGFAPGDNVIVSVQQGQLTITKNEHPKPIDARGKNKRSTNMNMGKLKRRKLDYKGNSY